MRLLFFVAVAAIAVGTGGGVSASFWDGIPVVSQVKSVVQLIAGDLSGALETQENFLNQAPSFISQVKSVYHFIDGDQAAAKRTHDQFIHEFFEPLTDNTPIVGHIKGGIHIAEGDREHGERVIKGATTATAAAIGGVIGGPAGAISAGAAMDGVITGIDSARNQKFTPHGVIEYASNIKNATPGEHFDALLGIGVEFAGGRAARGPKAKVKPLSDRNYDLGLQALKEKKPDSGPPYTELINEEKYDSGLLLAQPTSKKVEGSRIKWAHPLSVKKYGSGRGQGQISWLPPDMVYGKPVTEATIAEARILAENNGLERHYAERLVPFDFREVNDEVGNMNCYLCPLAARLNMQASELRQMLNIMKTVENDGVEKVSDIVEMYQRAGIENTAVEYAGLPGENFKEFLNNNLRSDEKHFTLAYSRGNVDKHVVHARVGRIWQDHFYMLTTDFQQPRFSRNRFATELPYGVDEIYLITDSNMLSDFRGSERGIRGPGI